jgi:hypothetical protein
MIYLIAIALAAIRIAGHKSEAFQAVAHLFIGWLIGAGVYQRATWTEGRSVAMQKIWLAIGLSVVEVICFLIGRFFTQE